ncbi:MULTISPECIES: hypothetical protein [unclassified Methylobacterium]|uniref:hypothetical protein n=1 Tax=unclassified Methylobacterium TaxID=2615210 RepID=UPI001FB9B356|nr:MULTISPECIES: hypothetical protein [unclassified Methylobacterium]MCJ2092051.1 hypothetical protein [Methylobacterium sp. J-072]MCJ2142396.1 hypothetical protein [Methylobacterium sp. E-066]
MATENRELEHSPLSGIVTRDGISVDVQIYRFAGPDEPWQLEVIDHEGGSTVWDYRFASDKHAYRAFNEAVAREGIGSFVSAQGKLLH